MKDMEKQTPEVNMLTLEIMNKGLDFSLPGRVVWGGVFCRLYKMQGTMPAVCSGIQPHKKKKILRL